MVTFVVITIKQFKKIIEKKFLLFFYENFQMNEAIRTQCLSHKVLCSHLNHVGELVAYCKVKRSSKLLNHLSYFLF